MGRRHADDVAQVWLSAVRAGHAAAVAHMLISLVESGGLSLAGTVKERMTHHGEFLAAVPCLELERCTALHPLTVSTRNLCSPRGKIRQKP